MKKQSLEQIWEQVEHGGLPNRVIDFEQQAGLVIPDHKLLAMMVILAVAIDLVPRMISTKQNTA